MTHGRSPRTRCDAAAYAFAAAALLSGSAAHAQPRTQPTAAEAREGRTLFGQGYAAFQALDYAAALPLFQRAFVLTRDPAMLYNIATTLESLHRNAEAATALRRYLAALPNASNRVEAEAHIARLEAPIASASPPPVASEAPSALTVSSSPPPTEGHIAPERLEPRPIWPWVVMGAGVVVAAAGGITAAAAGDPGAGQRFLAERDYLHAMDAANVQRLVGGVVAGVGVAVIVAGVIAVATYHPQAARQSLSWDIAPSRDGVMVQMGVRGFGL